MIVPHCLLSDSIHRKTLKNLQILLNVLIGLNCISIVMQMMRIIFCTKKFLNVMKKFLN